MSKKVEVEEVSINGVDYVRKSSVNEIAPTLEGMEYVIIRGRSSGVFAGYIEERSGEHFTLRNSRRIWYWSGAASLSQLAMEGTSNPDGCKIPCVVTKEEVLDAIEVLYCTKVAQDSIQAVKIWQK